MAEITDMYNNKAYYQHIYASEEINSRQNKEFYNGVAEYLQCVLSVKSMLDVGCATGMVVSAFRDLGVEAYGIDVSEYAISQVRDQDKPFVRAQSILEQLAADFPQHYDLVTCIEVAEHIPEEQTELFIKRLCELGNYIVFSSSPYDLEDRTHFNVQQQEYWCKRFAENGFYRCMDREMTLPTAWTICFSRFQMEPQQIVEAYERRDRINRKEQIGALEKERLKVDQAAQERDAIRQAYDSVIEERDEAITQRDAIRRADDVVIEERDEAITQRDALIHERDDIRTAFDEAVRQRDGYLLDLNRITTGFWWKITTPGRFVSGHLKRALLKTMNVLQGDPKTQHQMTQTWLNGDAMPAAGEPTPGSVPVQPLSVAEMFKDTGNPIWPIPTIIVGEEIKRLNLVTDTIEKSSLLGGVATALIVATQFCVQYGYELRIITRNAPPEPMNYEEILRINDLQRPAKVSYYSDFTGTPGAVPNFKMEITKMDIFFATSWWSAESIRRTTLRKRFFYIVQEAETFFYNYGGERRMCEEIMQDPNIDFIINSAYLYDYFRLYEPNVANNGVAFQPAFSQALYRVKQNDKEKKDGKYRLFFYGRPHNPRNLFNYGVNILEKAIAEQVIDTDRWEICFAGANVPPITFCDGSHSVNMGQMTWVEYADFLQNVDLALCLMYTPHPSYPPYDVACSGGVVVTNRYLTKQSFPQCSNVIMADLNEEGLLNALREGIELAMDNGKRGENYHNSTIPRRWTETLRDTMEFMQGKIK